MVGMTDKVDVDARGKASGEFLCIRIFIPLDKPLHQGVMLKPDRNSPQAWFRIQYEKLSLFCFLCGVMRHSELECATPAARNAEGKLPYDCKYRCLLVTLMCSYNPL